MNNRLLKLESLLLKRGQPADLAVDHEAMRATITQRLEALARGETLPPLTIERTAEDQRQIEEILQRLARIAERG